MYGFCKVVITTGFVDALSNDDELAMLLAHEIAHVLRCDLSQAQGQGESKWVYDQELLGLVVFPSLAFYRLAGKACWRL